jgi:hypothetical protein
MRRAGLKGQLSNFLCSCPKGYKLGPTGIPLKFGERIQYGL